MNEIESLLTKLLTELEAQDAQDLADIKTAEDTIKNANEIILNKKECIESRAKQKKNFRELVEAIKDKAARDTEALALLYISEKKNEDFEDFARATGIGDPTADEPTEKETIKEAS